MQGRKKVVLTETQSEYTEMKPSVAKQEKNQEEEEEEEGGGGP